MPRDEYEQYRADEHIEQYVDGFGWKAVVGGLFVGFLMVPGGIFLSLTTGGDIQSAVSWVTVILYLEIAKRLRTRLTRQETYILYWVASGVLTMAAGQVFSGFIWNQYLVQSPAAAKFNLAEHIPIWIAPPPGSEAYATRSLLHRDWWPQITFMAVLLVWGQLNFYSLGYALFRLTSDVERLPFPMAPVVAQGVTALVESDKETWRWKAFTSGSTIGVIFSFIYVGIPVLTQVVFGERLELLPIPFKDLSKNVQDIMPAVPLALPTNLGLILVGFVLPFWMVAGAFVAAVVGQLLLTPFVLHPLGMLPNWQRDTGYIDTLISNSVDFWVSWGIGTGVGVALLGLGAAVVVLRRRRATRGRAADKPPAGRGDIPVPLSLLFYVVSTTGTIILCHMLVPKFPIWILIGFGFVYTPIVSYISARMKGLTGMPQGFPYVKEGCFVLSGYKGVDIWSAPIPLGDAGQGAQTFREVELTGTRFTSLFKAQLFMLPVAVISSLLFWSLIWRMGEIPSAQYPYAATFWPVGAFNWCMWATATTSGSAFFLSAIKWPVIACGAGFSLVAYALVVVVGAPSLFFYGIVAGMAGDPMGYLPQFGGALLGRYYFARVYGPTEWHRRTPVLAAGFACGFGLIGMAAVAIALVSKAVSQMPF